MNGVRQITLMIFVLLHMVIIITMLVNQPSFAESPLCEINNNGTSCVLLRGECPCGYSCQFYQQYKYGPYVCGCKKNEGACEPSGKRECFGDVKRNCTYDCEWISTTCSRGCQDGYCKEEFCDNNPPKTKRCSEDGSRIEICLNGVWEISKTCQTDNSEYCYEDSQKNYECKRCECEPNFRAGQIRCVEREPELYEKCSDSPDCTSIFLRCPLGQVCDSGECKATGQSLQKNQSN